MIFPPKELNNIMKDVRETLNNPSPGRFDQDYPDVITHEEKEDPEEDNMAAYSLLSKINDPYYSKNETPGPSKVTEIQEGFEHSLTFFRK